MSDFPTQQPPQDHGDSMLPTTPLPPQPPVWIPDAERPLLEDIVRILRKRKRWIINSAAAATAVAVVWAIFAVPMYRSEAALLIEPNTPNVLDIDHVIGSAKATEEYYETQYEILRSRSLAERVIRDERLAEEPAFANAVSGPRSALRHALRSVQSEPDTSDAEQARLVRQYDNSLSIRPYRDTRLVRVAFSSPDPELSARVANAHANAFINQGLQLRTAASEEARDFLETKLDELKERVKVSEGALNEYRKEHGIISLDDKANLVIDRLAELNAKLTQAETERVTREADARLIRDRGPSSLPAVLSSPLIATLKENLARLEGEHAFLSTRFAAGYPRLAQLKAQIAESRRRLQTEMTDIVAGVESSFLSAQTKEDEIRRRLEEQKTTALELKDASVDYAMLEVEAETNRQLYDSVRSRVKETGMAAELRASNVVLLESALVPIDSSGWGKTPVLALALLMGGIAGVGLALLAERLDTRIRSSEELEQFGLPHLGSVPDFAAPPEGSASLLGGEAPLAPFRAENSLPVVYGNDSVGTEAFRRVRTSLLLSQADEPPRVILVTSSSASEGKTTTTLNLGAILAQMGGPVLVIDADLRRPSCSRMLGLPSGPGLTELLTGDGPSQGFQQAGAGVSILGAGKRPPNPTELLSSQRMRRLIEETRERFDYVLIDSPPVLPVSDSVILAGLVDGVVLVADQKTTARHSLRTAHQRLGLARAKILGTILNRADIDPGEYSYFADWEMAG